MMDLDLKALQLNESAWKEQDVLLMQNLPKEEWMKVFHSVTVRKKELYAKNNVICDALTEELSKPLQEEQALKFYHQFIALYMQDETDSSLILHYLPPLIQYFCEKNDIERVISLERIRIYYLANDFYSQADYWKEFAEWKKEALSYRVYYEQLSQKARKRLWLIQYNVLIHGVDQRILSMKEAMDLYEEMMEFSRQEHIQKLDEGCDDIQGVIEYLQDSMLIAITKIEEADANSKKRFFAIFDRYMEQHYPELKSPYELSVEQYACYIYRDYYRKKINLKTMFDQYLDYFAFRFQLANSQADLEEDDLIECINAIEFITMIGKKLKDSERKQEAIRLLGKFVEKRWDRGDRDSIIRIDDMLMKVGICFLSWDAVDAKPEKCMNQLIIQRNPSASIQASVTSKLALAIYRGINRQIPEFFAGVKSIPASEWKHYLTYGCVFANLGEAQIVGVRRIRHRYLFQEEKSREERHVLVGAKMVNKLPSLKKYAYIIEGHHSSYDTEAGYPKHFDRQKSDLAPFLDIISLVMAMDEETNPYLNFAGTSLSLEEFLENIKGERNHRFSGVLVDCILNSASLQDELHTILTTERENLIYAQFHNWGKIQFMEDEESLLEEIDEKILDFFTDQNMKKCKPYLNKLIHICKTTESPEIKGKGQYLLMRYYFFVKNFDKAYAMEQETNLLLEQTKNEELLVRNYLNAGSANIICENLELALEKFLQGSEIAKRVPGSEIEQSMLYAAIGNIFAKSYHYKKAISYYEKSMKIPTSDFETVRIGCMAGYCYSKVGNQKKVARIQNKVEKILTQREELWNYAFHIYFAVFSDCLGNEEGIDFHLESAIKERPDEDMFGYCIDEILMEVDLLETLGLYEKLTEQVDYYMELCRDRKYYETIYMTLTQRRLHCVTERYASEEHKRFKRLHVEAQRKAGEAKALRMEIMEKTFLDNIRLQSQNDQYLYNQAKLEDNMKRANSASKQKSQFLSSMSHEIRTPINAILGMNEMILRESKEDEILQYATDIHNAGKQLLSIVNDVLDYSKMEAGKMELVPEKYQLGEMINDLKNMMEPKLTEKKLQFIVKCDNEIPNVLYGDDIRIKQILLNLLSNAYKYTQKGSVTFQIDYTKMNEKSILVRFEVKDTGIGLSQEEIEKLAVPFERFNHVTNRGVEGTGLGMSIVTRLLEQMESKLVIDSTPGEGSSFSFELTQDVIEWRHLGHLEEVRQKVFHQAKQERETKPEGISAPEARVLVVDDNVVNLKVMQALLKKTKIQVTTAMSGQECLELCKENGYHIIFLDHMMPEMDGVETLKHLKEMKGVNEHTPIIALTANVLESGDDFYGKLGFDTLITKPVNIKALEDALMHYLPDYLIL